MIPIRQVPYLFLISALHSKCVPTSPKIIGYREKSAIVWASTVKPLNNSPPEERPLVNNGQILIALAYFNTFATLKSGHP